MKDNLSIAVNNTKKDADRIFWEDHLRPHLENLLSYQIEKYSDLLKNAKSVEARSFARTELHRIKKAKKES